MLSVLAESDNLQARMKALTRNWPCWHPQTSSLWNCDKTHFYSLSHPVSGILL